MAIPIINLEDFPSESKTLLEACQNLGCFRITNYDYFLPPSLPAQMKAVVRSLLDLPTEIKRRNTDVIAGSGYMAPSKINPHYEALGLYDIASGKAVDEFCTQLNASPHQRSISFRLSFFGIRAFTSRDIKKLQLGPNPTRSEVVR